MSKNTHTNTTAQTAKQSSTKATKAPNTVTVTFGTKELSVSAEVYEATLRGKAVRTLVYMNLTLDAYLAALPQTGLKAQGKKRVLAIAKSDTKLADMRVADLAIAKLEKRVLSSCRGKKWDEYVEDEVLSMTKAEILRGADGKAIKGDDGKYVKTGNRVAKYPIINAQSVGLKPRQLRVLNAVQKYFDKLSKAEDKLRAENQPKAEEQAS